MEIDHIGIVVNSIEEGVRHWGKMFGYRQMTGIVENVRQKIRVAFMEMENSITIKLVEPIDEKSPVYKFALRGGGLHHLCFKCGDVEIETKNLQKKGMRVLAEPQPGEAFDNERFSFLYANHGLNIELIDTKKKAKEL